MSDVLLEAALRATMIAAAALVMLWLLRVRSAAMRHRVWMVVMLGMLALPFWIAYGPEIALHVLPPMYSSPSGDIAALPAFDGPLGETTPSKQTAAELAAAGASRRTPEPSSSDTWSWRIGLLAIYLAGVAALLTRLSIGTARVRSLERRASLVKGRLTSDRIATPITVGLLRPRVLLPEGWDRWPPARLAAVLDHEHAHVARRDPLVQWLALLNRALFWFHPLAWWLERHLAALAEEACDGAVLASGHGPADYAEHLLELARAASRRPMRQVVGMSMPGRMLPMRIAKILEGDVGAPATRKAVAGAAVVAVLAASAIGTITLGQEPTSAEQPASAQEAASMQGLLEVYQLALENDPVGIEEAAAQQELLMQVADAYFKVLAAEDTLAAQEAARQSIAGVREQAERRFEVGLISITEVLEARAGSAQASADLLMAERMLASSKVELEGIVGEDVGNLSKLIEDLPLNAPDTAASSLTERETRDAYRSVIAEVARVQALDEAVRAIQTALKATQAGFEVGTRTTLDVLAQENHLRDVETAYRLGRYDYISSVLRLERATAGLTIESLETIETWLVGSEQR